MITKSQLIEALKSSNIFDNCKDTFYIVPLDRNLQKYSFKDGYNCFIPFSINQTDFVYYLPDLYLETDVKNCKVRITQYESYTMVFDEDSLNKFLSKCKDIYSEYKLELKKNSN